MAKAAEEIKARAQAVAARRNTASTAETPPSPTTAASKRPSRTTPPRTTGTRISADLEPELYRKLVRHSFELADELGRTRVHHVEVVRALLEIMTTDTDLRDRVETWIRDHSPA